MSEKRFELVNGIITDMQDNERMYGIFELVDKLNELCEENEQLRKYNGQLKKRLEKINGGYGHLTHRNGLTANEWLIESQEKELQKKNEQISDWIEQHSKDVAKIGEQQATISDLKEENEQLQKQIDEYNLILKQHEFAEKEGFR